MYTGPALEAQNYRIDTLTLTEPAIVAGLINTLLAQNLADGTVCVLIRIFDFEGDAVPTTLTVQGNACVDNEDGTYSFAPEASGDPVSGTIDACGVFGNNTDGDLPTLGFPITLPSEETVVLPLRNIVVSGKVVADGVVDGHLAGAIAGADAEMVEIEVTPGNALPLNSVLGDENKDVDTNGDGEIDGWTLTSTFTAASVSFR